MQNIVLFMVICAPLLACTFTAPPAALTPTAATEAPAATDTTVPTATETLRPTVTSLPTFTPVNQALPTTIPVTQNSTAGNGGFGFGSVGGSASVQNDTGGSTSNNTQRGVAPVGVREVTEAPASGGTGIGSVGVGSRGGGSVISVTSTPANSSQSVEVVPGTPSPLTPTVPPTVNQRYTHAVAAGNNLVVTYDITLLRGMVVVWVVSPGGQVIWQEGFTETIDSETEIAAPETGEYDILAYV
ncbi:MAG: hypothetical protein AAF787_02895, partial [Chloroflexota bacterium]